MKLPKFLLADNTDHPENVYVVHTEYPRFIIDLKDDDLTWLEEFDASDEKDLEEQAPILIQSAMDFYDREIERFEG